MKKPKTQLSTIISAAKRLKLNTYQLHKQGESNLGRSVVISNDKGDFCILSSKKTGFYPAVPVWFKMLCNSKYSSQKLLQKLGYKTIKTIYFDANNFANSTAISKQSASVSKFPVLLKPEEGFKGKGIMIIANATELKRATKNLIAEKKSFMLQEIVMDTEYRVLVINRQVFVAHTKEFPSIIGDGARTVKDLLTEDVLQDKNFIKSELDRNNLKTSSILENGKVLATHITRKGGTTLHTYGNIPKNIEKWALRLAKDLNCETVGIDVFIPENTNEFKKYKIIEINASPGFTYLESRYGQADLVKMIADDVLKKYFELR